MIGFHPGVMRLSVHKHATNMKVNVSKVKFKKGWNTKKSKMTLAAIFYCATASALSCKRGVISRSLVWIISTVTTAVDVKKRTNETLFVWERPKSWIKSYTSLRISSVQSLVCWESENILCWNCNLSLSVLSRESNVSGLGVVLHLVTCIFIPTVLTSCPDD